MKFNPRSIEARLTLRMISPWEMPSIAWQALEADLDGPAIRRMAAFDNPTGFETDAILPRFMEEAGMRMLNAAEASYRVAYDKAREILDCRKDPLPELRFLEQMWMRSDYPVELSTLGMLSDQAYIEGFSDNIRRVARDELILFVREFEATHHLS